MGKSGRKERWQETEVKRGGQHFWSCFFAKFLEICWVLSCGLLS